MPHIVIEASPALVEAIAWPQVLRGIHEHLCASGWAAPADMKSRVLPIVAGLCGEDSAARQLVATLVLTNPRPAQVCEQMAAAVHEHLSHAIEAIEANNAAGPGAWTQCCVFLREVPKAHYLKRQWNAPPEKHQPEAKETR